jgi:multicomponent Na+:H+ antiporter subunit D
MSAAAPWAVLVPLVGGILAFLAAAKQAGAIALFSALGLLAAAAGVAAEVWTAGPRHHLLGGWGAPLGIELYVDGLGAAFLLTTALVGLSIALYGLGGFPSGHRAQKWHPAEAFWPLFLLLLAGLAALFVTADAFNAYVALEVISLAGVGLVVLAQDRIARSAALRYLLATFVGSLAYLMGLALLYAGYHTLDLALLADRMAAGGPVALPAALVVAGLALKTALFPLHFWLPRAHASAPAPVSAALSALVVTGSYYLLLRFWFDVFPEEVARPAAPLLGALGASAVIWGSLQALRQARLKLMIAYSTVAQVGYLFLVFPLAPVPEGILPAQTVGDDAWAAAVYLAISHAFAKAAMFLAAGAVVEAFGHDRVDGLGGIATRLPVTTYAFGLAGLSLIGLPPSGGFIAKWLFLVAALKGGVWWWAAVVLVGGVLTAGYVFLVIGKNFTAPAAPTAPARPVPRTMEFAALTLALVSFGLGLRAAEPLAFINIGSPFAQPQLEVGR